MRRASSEHSEAIDIIGEVKCWVRDLEAAWQQEDRGGSRNEVTRDAAAMVIDFDIAAPRPTVWEYFVVPGNGPNGAEPTRCAKAAKGGRRGVGTVNHCMHGPAAIIEEILDWRPFDYLTLTTLLPMPDAPKVLMSYAFSDRDDGGTHVEIRVAKPKPKTKAFLEQVGPEFHKHITDEFATLRGMLERQGGPAADIEEPGLPRSAARFLTQPVPAR